MAKLIVARIRLPLFSIKHPEAFQVMSSLPVPQPSSLVGLLAYCIGMAKRLGTPTLKHVKDWVKEGKLLAARAAYIETGIPMVPSSVVLRRFRVADEGYVRKEKHEALMSAIKQKDLSALKSVLEVKLMDALYREYVMGHELLCAWAIASDVDLEPRWLYLAQRLGDTESLCTVVNVEALEAEVYETNKVITKFPTPAEGLDGLTEGTHTLIRMCDERRELRLYVVPCEIRVEKLEGGLAVPIIRPSEVKVIYKEPVEVIRAKDLVLTAFWPAKKVSRRER